MMFRKLLLGGALLFLTFLIFKGWFTQALLSGGDFQAYYKETFINFSFFPSPAWSWTLGAGLGTNNASLLWNYVVVQMPIALFGNLLGFSWPMIQRVGYLFPYLILSLLLPYYYLKKFFPSIYAFLGLIVFSFNTYILMLISGGQIFLSLAYVLIPAIFYYFYKLVSRVKSENNQKKLYTFCLFTLLFSLQVLLDVRIAYATLTLVFLFLCINVLLTKNYKDIIYLPLALVATGFLHFFWLLPTILIRQNPLASFGEEYVSTQIVTFLSFAKFENTISLLQSNWPENIFGKVYFMRPEFLVLPILAFSSLLFLKNEKKEIKILVLFFALAALLGSFLAKGTNEPFGNIYDYMFKYVPGFVMFRDSSKWYPLMAISYGFLVPYSVMHTYNLTARYKKFSIFNFQFSNNFKIFNLQNLFLLLTVFYLLLLIRPAWTGQLGGVLKPSQFPNDYAKLEQFISKDKNFYRTFWIPRTSTFSFYSVIHPITTGYDFLHEYSADKIIKKLSNPNFKTILQDISVKYVIIPNDTEHKIFLRDRKYDDVQYKKAVKQLSKVGYLKEIEGFGNIKIFEVPDYKEHIWSDKVGLVSNFTFINPTRYSVTVKDAKKGDVIVLSENFDNKWIAISSQFTVHSSRFNNRLNGFVLPQDGDYSFEIYYTVQDWVNLGLVVSGISLGGILGYLLYSRKHI